MSTETTSLSAAKTKDLLGPGAFGLKIDSDAGLPGLAIRSALAGSRFVEHRLVETSAIRERCGRDDLSPLGSYGEGPNRREYYRHASGGELMRTKSFGEHLIADRGRTVLSAPDGARTDLWQRFFLGQVLPTTASIQGLEIFHASSVTVDDGVIALAGQSGAGKSTLAGALMASGARFFADDVLAVDVAVSGNAAFPGPGLIALSGSQAKDLDLKDEVLKVDDSKAIFETSGERRARPIRAFILLTRDDAADTPQFNPCPPSHLMASTFDALPRSSERLRRLLRVCASLASDAQALELRFSLRSDPAELVGEILKRLAVGPGS